MQVNDEYEEKMNGDSRFFLRGTIRTFLTCGVFVLAELTSINIIYQGNDVRLSNQLLVQALPEWLPCWQLSLNKGWINSFQVSHAWAFPYQPTTKKGNGLHAAVALKDTKSPLKVIIGNLSGEEELMHIGYR